MNKIILYVSCTAFVVCALSPSLAYAYYGKELCRYPEFSCIKIKKGDTWEKR